MLPVARAVLLLSGTALSTAGCGGAVPFECQSDAECTHDGAEGRCERTGYCSFPDEGCETGWRYGELAEGSYAEACVVQCVLGLSLGGLLLSGTTTGTGHSCALLRGGSVSCWGNGAEGALGDGVDGGPSPVPVRVAGLPPVTAIAAGGGHTCALAEDGTVWCWGSNDAWQLGELGSGLGPVRVTALDGAGAPATQIAAGGGHSCARASVGTGCWGANSRGQLGLGTTSAVSLPDLVDFELGFQDVAAGDGHTCGRTLAGTVHCFGDNGFLQVGAVDPDPPYPSPTMLATQARAAQIDLGGAHSCMVTSNESVQCWGNNQAFGQLGQPPTLKESRAPVPVQLPAPIVQVATGGTHSCALDVDGRAWCWGGNDFGQHGPGRGKSPIEPEPVRVELSGGIVEIAAGSLHTCARTAKDEVYCWGANEQGQLGNGAIDADGQSEPDAAVMGALGCE